MNGQEKRIEGTAGDLVALVDSLVPERTLAYGELNGPDLDLLVHPAAERALRAGLRERGFIDLGRWQVRPHPERLDVVDLLPVADWRLEPQELEALFDEALACNGCENLATPSPHHQLLILARRAIYERRPESLVRRIAEPALAKDPDAFRRAREVAPAWSATRALEVVERTLSGARVGRVGRSRAVAARARADGAGATDAIREGLRVAVPKLRRGGVLVALSGLDGSGKSSLATQLESLAGAIGANSTVVWSSLSHHPRWLHRVADLARLALFPRRGDGGAGSAEENRKRAGADLRRRSGALTFAWTLLVTARLGFALARATWPRVLRGGLVICDRYVLDSWAELSHRYGTERNYRLQVRLLRLLTPEPDLAYLLDVPPEVASERKLDYSTEVNRQRAELYRVHRDALGVRLLDGTRPRSELVAQIAPELAAALR